MKSTVYKLFLMKLALCLMNASVHTHLQYNTFNGVAYDLTHDVPYS